MKHSEAYLLTHDIDWFFQANGVYYHCASNGGLIPSKCRDVKMLNRMKRAVRSMPEISTEIAINEAYVEKVVQREVEFYRQQLAALDAHVQAELTVDVDTIRNHFLSSFEFMARRGFVSMDRIVEREDDVNDAGKESSYIIIASPSKGFMPTDIFYDHPEDEIVFPNLSHGIKRVSDFEVTIII